LLLTAIKRLEFLSAWQTSDDDQLLQKGCMKVYERLAEAFKAEGTTHIFGMMGDGNMYRARSC
jgi:hypothetical protein